MLYTLPPKNIPFHLGVYRCRLLPIRVQSGPIFQLCMRRTNISTLSKRIHTLAAGVTRMILSRSINPNLCIFQCFLYDHSSYKYTYIEKFHNKLTSTPHTRHHCIPPLYRRCFSPPRVYGEPQRPSERALMLLSTGCFGFCTSF